MARPHPGDATPWATIALAGGLAVLALGTLLVVSLRDPSAGRSLGWAMVLEFGLGREATIPIALAGGAPAWSVALASTAQNLCLGVLASPVITYLLHRWQHETHFVARRLRRLERAAARRQATIDRWGPWGLFGFMLIPLLTNGPVVAVLAGRLAGLHGWRLWIPVVGGVVTMATAWTWGHGRLLALVGDLAWWMPIAIVAVMVVILLAGAWYDSVRERRADDSPRIQ